MARGSMSIIRSVSFLFYVALCCSSLFLRGAARDPSVIIIGAGMSGISAAKTMSDAGIKDFLILEATNRIGGRIQKENFAGVSVEIGANWVEGVGGPQMNPIWPMVHNDLKLKTFNSDYKNLSANTYDQGGLMKQPTVKKAMDVADKISEMVSSISTYLTAHKKHDISILAAQRFSNKVPSTPLEMAYDYYTYDYEFAEPPRVSSLQNTEPLPTFTNFGKDVCFVADTRGFEAVVHHVGKQCLTYKNGVVNDPRVLLNKVVVEIRHSPSGVIVRTEDGAIYQSRFAMVSVSVGVLQTKLIDFVPNLPEWKLLAIYQFDMAVYTKIFVKFPKVFWPTGNGTEFFLYTHEERGYYPVWQQLDAQFPGSNMLVVTVTDDESRRIEQHSDSETQKEIMAVLRDMFGENIPEPTHILVPKWWSNRFYKGSFSNWPIGVTRYEQYDQLRAPVGSVYFTGEHTSKDYNGYVHGAYLAGMDSANILVNCLKKGTCNYYGMANGTCAAMNFGYTADNARGLKS